jgi:hypothetical protein
MKIRVSAAVFSLAKRDVKKLEASIASSKKRIEKTRKHKLYKYFVPRMERVLAKRMKRLAILKSSLKKLGKV